MKINILIDKLIKTIGIGVMVLLFASASILEAATSDKTSPINTPFNPNGQAISQTIVFSVTSALTITKPDIAKEAVDTTKTYYKWTANGVWSESTGVLFVNPTPTPPVTYPETESDVQSFTVTQMAADAGPGTYTVTIDIEKYYKMHPTGSTKTDDYVPCPIGLGHTKEKIILVINIIGVETETVVTSPIDRKRKRLGVGEKVKLTLKPTSVTPVSWVVDGVNASESGNSVIFTAPDRKKNITITATAGGISSPVPFEVIEPEGVMFERETGTNVRHTINTVSCGFRGRPYILPADVSFRNIAIREGTNNAVASGYLILKNGESHTPGAWPGAPVGDVVEGKGSFVERCDSVSSNDYTWTPHAIGVFTWDIPWYFRVGTGAEYPFAIVVQTETTDATGKLTISKGSGNSPHSEFANFSDASSNY